MDPGHARTSWTSSSTCSSAQLISSVNCRSRWPLPTVKLLASRIRYRFCSYLVLNRFFSNFAACQPASGLRGIASFAGWSGRWASCLENPTNACSIVCDVKEDILASYLKTAWDSALILGVFKFTGANGSLRKTCSRYSGGEAWASVIAVRMRVLAHWLIQEFWCDVHCITGGGSSSPGPGTTSKVSWCIPKYLGASVSIHSDSQLTYRSWMRRRMCATDIRHMTSPWQHRMSMRISYITLAKCAVHTHN